MNPLTPAEEIYADMYVRTLVPYALTLIEKRRAEGSCEEGLSAAEEAGRLARDVAYSCVTRHRLVVEAQEQEMPTSGADTYAGLVQWWLKPMNDLLNQAEQVPS